MGVEMLRRAQHDSVVLLPLPAVVPELKHATSSPATLPIIWGDWQRRSHRREVVKLLRHQRIDIQLPEPSPPAQPLPAHHLSRAERAHYRLSWVQRLARNAHALTTGQVTIKLFGVPPAFAAFLGLSAV